jgi:hypothetical protein
MVVSGGESITKAASGEGCRRARAWRSEFSLRCSVQVRLFELHQEYQVVLTAGTSGDSENDALCIRQDWYAADLANTGIIMPLAPLADWSNFYVIVGSAAAGLTGLTFVVITLSAEANRASAIGLRTFVTPTIVHFGAALALAVFLSVPHLALLGLGIGFGVSGLAGLLYIGAV